MLMQEIEKKIQEALAAGHITEADAREIRRIHEEKDFDCLD
jgi:hypothetical protein